MNLYNYHAQPESLLAFKYRFEIPKLLWRELSTKWHYLDQLDQATIVTAYGKVLCRDPLYAVCYSIVTDSLLSKEIENRLPLELFDVYHGIYVAHSISRVVSPFNMSYLPRFVTTAANYMKKNPRGLTFIRTHNGISCTVDYRAQEYIAQVRYETQ